MNVALQALQALHTSCLLLLAVYVGHAGAVCAGLDSGRLRRWAAACVILPASLIALFNVLSAAGIFGTTPATIALAILALILRAVSWHRGTPSVTRILARDLSDLARIVGLLARGPQGLVFAGLIAAASLAVGRAMAYPPLAWDTLTYHAVKPVLWLQSGGALTLDAPGGWSTHAGRMAGADVVTAWAMLAGPGDSVWGAADLFWWLALAVGLLFLGAESGLRARDRVAVMAYGCFVPTTFLAVGSGYAEIAVAATMCLTLGLLANAHRTGAAGAWVVGAFGIALLMSMKLIVWPGVAVLSAFALAIGLRSKRPLDPGRAIAWASALIGAAAIALPGPIRNWLDTGYPLSVPLTLGPVTLGPANPELDLLESTFSRVIDHGLMAELEALSWSFGSPFRIEPQFTITALPLLALAAWGAAREIRRGGSARTRTLWLLAVLGAVLASWLSPSLETVRIHWMQANPRHLLPIVLPLLPLAMLAARGQPTIERLTRLTLVGGALAHAGLCVAALWGMGSFAHATIPAALALLTLVIFPVAGAQWRRRTGRPPIGPVRLAAAAFATAACLASFGFYDSPSPRRNALLAERSPLGAVPRYWVEPARVLDQPGHPFTIAVTSGLEPAADNWFMYPLFGSLHQNRLVYAPVTDSAAILPLAPGHGRMQRARFDVWWRHLIEREVDWVMAFHPTTLEVGWMQKHPSRFEYSKGDHQSWGLYRVKRERPTPRAATRP